MPQAYLQWSAKKGARLRLVDHEIACPRRNQLRKVLRVLVRVLRLRVHAFGGACGEGTQKIGRPRVNDRDMGSACRVEQVPDSRERVPAPLPAARRILL